MWTLWAAIMVIDPDGRVVVDTEGPLPLELSAEWSRGRKVQGLSLWGAEMTDPGLIVEIDTGPVRGGDLRMKRRQSQSIEGAGRLQIVRPVFRDATWEVRLLAGMVGSQEGPACDVERLETRFEDGTGWRIPADLEGDGPVDAGGFVIERAAGDEPDGALGRTAAGWVRWTGEGPPPVLAVDAVAEPHVTLGVGCVEVTVTMTPTDVAALLAP